MSPGDPLIDTREWSADEIEYNIGTHVAERTETDWVWGSGFELMDEQQGNGMITVVEARPSRNEKTYSHINYSRVNAVPFVID